MLSVSAAADDVLHVAADVIVVPMFKGGIEGPGAAALLTALALDELPSTPDFRGDIGQHLLLAAPSLTASGVLFVGLGRMDEADTERLRRAAGVAARACRNVRRVATTLAQVNSGAETAAAVAEGFLLGAYEDRRFKTSGEAAKLAEVVILTPSSQISDVDEALHRARIYAEATNAARDLVNLPPDEKRPGRLAERIAELVGDGVEVRIRDERELAEEGFGGVLAVGRGSSSPPRVVELTYRPESPLGSVALVGKGITFDTGGLNLKRTPYMNTMKSDMAGAAAVAATCSALAALDVRLEVTAVLPLAENMPGADAQRPDDVIRMYGGKTVEVADTDAEGRLILGDALAYVSQKEPDAIIDLATLTGSAIAAVGNLAAAVMGNDTDVVTSVCRAADAVGEPVWRLPLWPDLDRWYDSPIADMNNTGDGVGAGSIMGGLFLQRFVGDVPWAHLDIAGPAFLTEDLSAHYLPTGGTGFGVRTLLAWLERRAG